MTHRHKDGLGVKVGASTDVRLPLSIPPAPHDPLWSRLSTSKGVLSPIPQWPLHTAAPTLSVLLPTPQLPLPPPSRRGARPLQQERLI